jgi:ABC-type transport system involved in cytochrome c biogenesis permease subunit
MIARASRSDVMKGIRLPLLALLALVLAACSRPVPRLEGDVERTEPWNKETVAQLASIPVQDNGREKPLSVLAAFRLYDVHGRRDLKYSVLAADGTEKKFTLEPTEWLLDVWCYPRQAARYPLFRIEHSGVMDALGFANDGQKQDFVYVSYDKVYGVVDKLQGLARSYGQKDQKQRSTVEEHIVQLWRDFLTYDALQRQFGAFHYSVSVAEAEVQAVFGSEQVTVGNIATHADQFRGMLAKSDADLSNAPKDLIRVAEFVGKVISNDEDGVGVIAPTAAEEVKWLTLGAAFEGIIKGQKGSVVDMFTSMQRAVSATSLPEKQTALLQFKDASIAAAGTHYDKVQIERETYYYRASWHYQSIHWFLLAFVLAAVTWLMPRNKVKILWWASMLVSIAGLGMLSYDLTLRCLITGHPPIKNLYDTFLFIAAVGVLLLLGTEFVMPRRIALAAAPFLGALLVMFARIYEVTNASDTMDPLVAVLDSNFWLATHVTTINIGYAAGLVAAILANVWIIMRVFRLSHPNDVPAKALVRMCYGVTCFGLLFSVVGTILGGVWANDSWGRFWGWDPKENGALMICLGQIALLHARFTGWVRDFGFVVWAGIIGMVVVFSWFHVNLLGVGLHSYGFSAGLLDAVWTCYSVQLGFLLVGALDVVLRPSPAKAAAPVKSAAWPVT